MDPGFYEDLTGRLDGLLIVLEDRLNCDDVSVIHQFTGARYDALALEEIARTAAQRQIGITIREHVGVLALAGLLPDGLPAPGRELMASLTVLSARVAARAEGIAEGDYLDRIVRLWTDGPRLYRAGHGRAARGVECDPARRRRPNAR